MQNEIHIDGLGHGGEGLGRIDGEVCFVPGALPGDTVRVGEIQRRKGVARARVGTLDFGRVARKFSK